MSSFDDLSDSIEKLGRKLYEQGRKTANIAKLKIDLKSLDLKRYDCQAKLGEKFYKLYEHDEIKDPKILQPLMDQIEELSKIEVKIREVLMKLEEIVLETEEEILNNDEEPKKEPEKESDKGEMT